MATWHDFPTAGAAAMTETLAGAAAVAEPGCCRSPLCWLVGEASRPPCHGGDPAPLTGALLACVCGTPCTPAWQRLGHGALVGTLTPWDGSAVAVGHL